ncbi:MAG: TonB-dependent receptor plug domain-containing protein [Desulfobacteraceae bacterium]|jgi:outer membrane receptor for ferrienterochelin and colicins
MMKVIRKFYQLLVIGLLLNITATSGFSEETEFENAANHSMENMIVTATKTERSLEDISTNMTVLTQKDIQACQPTDVMDLLRHVPGLVLNGMGSSKSSFYAGSRGIQPSSRGMLIMVDGIERR